MAKDQAVSGVIFLHQTFSNRMEFEKKGKKEIEKQEIRTSINQPKRYGGE